LITKSTGSIVPTKFPTEVVPVLPPSFQKPRLPLDSDNLADEFVWIHDRTLLSPTLYDAVPMRLAASFGDFYNGAIYIANPLPGSNPRVGFGMTPGSYIG